MMKQASVRLSNVEFRREANNDSNSTVKEAWAKFKTYFVEEVMPLIASAYGMNFYR